MRYYRINKEHWINTDVFFPILLIVIWRALQFMAALIQKIFPATGGRAKMQRGMLRMVSLHLLLTTGVRDISAKKVLIICTVLLANGRYLIMRMQLTGCLQNLMLTEPG